MPGVTAAPHWTTGAETSPVMQEQDAELFIKSVKVKGGLSRTDGKACGRTESVFDTALLQWRYSDLKTYP